MKKPSIGGPHRARCRSHTVPAQRGIALVVALILLVLITLVGLAAVRGTIMQQRMSSNLYDREQAFQAAEAAMRVAAAQLRTTPALVARDCSIGTTRCPGNPFTDANLPAGAVHTVPASSAGGGAGYSASSTAYMQPQFVVEYMGQASSGLNSSSANCQQAGSKLTCGSTTYLYYRITARSGDPAQVGDRAVVTLQSVIKQG